MLDKAERVSLAVELSKLSGDCVAAAVYVADPDAALGMSVLYVKAVKDKAQAVYDRLMKEVAD